MGPVVFIIERVKSGNYGAKIVKNDNLANNDYVIQMRIIMAVPHKGSFGLPKQCFGLRLWTSKGDYWNFVFFSSNLYRVQRKVWPILVNHLYLFFHRTNNVGWVLGRMHSLRHWASGKWQRYLQLLSWCYGLKGEWATQHRLSTCS